MIKVVGVGPGSKDYVLPLAKREIENAKILIGGKRILTDYANENQEIFPITKDIEKVINFIKQNVAKDIVLTVSGDPGYYSLLDAIRENFPQNLIEVIPGISSLQVAFARLNLPWHNAKFLSFHGRIPKDEDLTFNKEKILGLLTDGIYNSKKIAEVLENFSWNKKANFIVFERLSYDDEKITKMTLEEAKNFTPISHGVIIVYDEVF